MNSLVKKAVAGALMAAASVSAFALNITPPTAGPTPLPSSGNGGVVVQIWDAAAGVSETAYLGINFNDFTPGSANATQSIDFGVIGGTAFNTYFGSLISKGDTISFNVSGANGSGLNSLETTVATSVSDPLAGLTNASILNAVTKLNTAIGSIMNGANSSPGAPNYTDLCYSGVNPCIGPTLGSVGFGFIGTAGDKYGNNLPYSASGVAGGARLTMYQLTQGGSKLTPPPTASAAYAGTWALSSTGDLTYNVSAVPLPAALWLFASGALGLAGVARRRSGVAAV